MLSVDEFKTKLPFNYETMKKIIHMGEKQFSLNLYVEDIFTKYIKLIHDIDFSFKCNIINKKLIISDIVIKPKKEHTKIVTFIDELVSELNKPLPKVKKEVNEPKRRISILEV